VPVTLQFDETKYSFASIMDARANFLNCSTKRKTETAEDDLEEVPGWSDAIEYHGGIRV
jgi:hypothetical protein